MTGLLVRSRTANFRILPQGLVGNTPKAQAAIDSPEFEAAYNEFSALIESRVEDYTSEPVSWSEVEPQLNNLSSLQKEGLKLILMLV